METIEALEAAAHFPDLLNKVENGEGIMITRHNKPVACLMPVLQPNAASIRETINRIKENSMGNRLMGDWKSMRDEGRK